MTTEPLAQLLAAIDQLNRADPNRVLIGGIEHPQELAYAERLTAWVLRLNPKASVWLRIAARGQHVQRWKIPRDTYPRTREGYLRWREKLKHMHAEIVGALMRQSQWLQADIEKVSGLILKRPGADKADLQVLEDALCLIFIESQLAEVQGKITDQRLREVVAKTWGKMSKQAQAEALQLPLKPAQKAWLAQVVSEAK